MGSANYSPDLRTQLLAAVPAVALRANPNIVPGADILEDLHVGAWLAGPIVRDKLWFSFSPRYAAGSVTFSATTTPTARRCWTTTLMWTTSAKVAWQVTRTASSRNFNNLQYKLIVTGMAGNVAESRARNLNDKYPDVHQVKFTSPFGSRVVVDVSWSRFRADDNSARREVQAGDISRFDALTNTYTVALPDCTGTTDVQGSSPDQRGDFYRTS